MLIFGKPADARSLRCLAFATIAGLLTGCASNGAGVPDRPSRPAKPAAARPAAPTAAGKADPAPAPPAPLAGAAAATGPAQPPATTAAAGSSVPAQTPEERRAALEHRLDDSLGSFDRELTAERERVAKERDARAAQSGSAVTEGPTSDATANNTAGVRPPGSRPGDLRSERGAREEKGKQAGTAGTPSNNPNGAAGRNIPDGSDDDIVARRLRKAAEAETDPELKERLWQEYIEYKRSGQNKG